MDFILVFGLGLIIGSFLNAVIHRLEKEESVLKGRSYCPHCKHTLEWYDLLPLLSFVLLRGKCRYCNQSISWQYPLVEVLTGLLFGLIFKFQFLIANEFSNFLILQTIYFFTIASLLIVLFVYDLKHYILPDKIVFPVISIAALYRIFEFEGLEYLVNPLLAAFGAAGFFFFIFAVSKGRAMGFGDVKLALFMGLFLGWPNILVALFGAFMAGAILGIALLVLKKKGMKSEVPFGPFLIAGTFAALFWGEVIVDWYLAFLLV